MSDLVTRVARLFVVPADVASAAPPPITARAHGVAEAVHAPVAVFLCSAGEATALACGAALELARASRSATALACVWTGLDAPAARRPALPAARRLARKLAARGLDAAPAGRLAVVRLPSDGTAAAAAARDAIAAAQGPAAVTLAGPRCDATDTLLLTADAVCVVGRPDSAVASLAASSLPVPASHLPVRHGAAASLLARAGVVATPALRRGLLGDVA
jgi:hypothetical protein